MTWRDVRHELDELLDGHLAQAAALLVAQQASEHDDDERIDAPTLHRYAPRVVFQVFHEGRLAMRSANAPAEPMVTGARRLQGFHTVEMNGERWRVFATRGAENDVQVFVGEHERSRASILWAVLRSTMWPVVFALPLLALAGWWAVRQGVQPLRALGGTLATRKAADLDAVQLPDAPSEMQPMLDALNVRRAAPAAAAFLMCARQGLEFLPARLQPRHRSRLGLQPLAEQAPGSFGARARPATGHEAIAPYPPRR